jgi:4-hydroxybenzoate polyprenyltransferase
MLERIKHVPSTIIAVLITLAALVMVYLDKATLTEVSISVPVILIALGYKPKAKIQPNEEK